MEPDPPHAGRLTVRVERDLAGVDPAAWDALDHGHSPFLEYGFLRTLEESNSIGGASGWSPHYVLAEGSGADGASRLLGAVACFLKEHSYGEYIFDWGWARASTRAGIPYYPKLVVAAPVTPATGPRLLLPRESTAELTREDVARVLVAAVRELADALECSSIHWLFTTAEEHAFLASAGFMSRASFQFHWTNRGYADFDAFLATLSSRKRKQIRKERARAREQVDAIQFVTGARLECDDLVALDRFYRRTTRSHGGQDYLRPGFFQALAHHLSHRMVFVRAVRRDEIVAGALYLETDAALYGRYWGADEHLPFLHFELAYYQGIERCIERGLSLFEAGAQGEHKLLRGFAPAPTYSSHWIRHPGLRDAVRRFLAEEAAALPPYLQELERFTPYRKS